MSTNTGIIAAMAHALRENDPNQAMRLGQRGLWGGHEEPEFLYLYGISIVNHFGLLGFGPVRSSGLYEAARRLLAIAARRGHDHAEVVGKVLENFTTLGCISEEEALARWLAGHDTQGTAGVSRAPRAVVVDDHAPVGSWFRSIARWTRWECISLQDPREASALITSGEPCDLLLVDDRMPNLSGLDLVIAARRRSPGLPVVFMYSEDVDMAFDAMEAGASAVAVKPFIDGSMIVALCAALGLRTPGELRSCPQDAKQG